MSASIYKFSLTITSFNRHMTCLISTLSQYLQSTSRSFISNTQTLINIKVVIFYISI